MTADATGLVAAAAPWAAGPWTGGADRAAGASALDTGPDRSRPPAASASARCSSRVLAIWDSSPWSESCYSNGALVGGASQLARRQSG